MHTFFLEAGMKQAPIATPVTAVERLIEDAERWSHAAPCWPAAIVKTTIKIGRTA